MPNAMSDHANINIWQKLTYQQTDRDKIRTFVLWI